MKEQYRRERKLLAQMKNENRLSLAWYFAKIVVEFYEGELDVEYTINLLASNYKVRIYYTDLIEFLLQIRNGIYCKTLGAYCRKICAAFWELYIYKCHDISKDTAISRIKARYDPVPRTNYTGAVLRKAFDECEHALALLSSRPVFLMMKDDDRWMDFLSDESFVKDELGVH